jgi:hypothetical protein
MWTPELVRIRFIEAAATERFLQKPRNPDARGYWPEFVHNQEDRDGWDKKAEADHLEIWQGRGAAKADALYRHYECLAWTIERLTDPYRRQLVWAFAFCRAYKRDFGKLCKKNGWVKTTAYNRLNRAWEQLAFDLNNEAVMLRLPAQQWIGHETVPNVPIESSVESCARTAAIKFTPAFRTEESRDLLITPEGVADFTKHLDAVNAERRRSQEREAKRRAKIGAMAS